MIADRLLGVHRSAKLSDPHRSITGFEAMPSICDLRRISRSGCPTIPNLNDIDIEARVILEFPRLSDRGYAPAWTPG